MMNDQMMQQVLNRLDALSVKLGTTAAYLWSVLLRQAYVTAYVDLVVAGLLFVLVIVGAVAAVKFYKWCEEKNTYGEWPVSGAAGFAFSIVAVAIGLPTCIAEVLDAVTILANPAYWAYTHLF